MILMGDEVGRTQYGNNNSYCHDGELGWLDWSLDRAPRRESAALRRHVIAFRARHPVLRSADHLTGKDIAGSGYPRHLLARRPRGSPITSDGSRTSGVPVGAAGTPSAAACRTT